jgi:hypothetical protein
MMRAPRLPDWPERLAAFIEGRRDLPFEWADNDCCVLAADAVLAMTGRDFLVGFRGRYATEAEAEALMGPGGLEAFLPRVMAAFGAPGVVPAEAQRGDVALIGLENQLVCGVVTGPHIAAPGARGLAFVPLRRATMAWGV